MRVLSGATPPDVLLFDRVDRGGPHRLDDGDESARGTQRRQQLGALRAGIQQVLHEVDAAESPRAASRQGEPILRVVQHRGALRASNHDEGVVLPGPSEREGAREDPVERGLPRRARQDALVDYLPQPERAWNARRRRLRRMPGAPVRRLADESEALIKAAQQNWE